MRIVRLASKEHDDPLSGAGAKSVGGRWNSPGRAAVYTSETLALAVLENLVHIDTTEDLPDDRRYWVYELDRGDYTEVTVGDLPGRWADDVSITREVGNDFLDDEKHLALVVPSVVVRIERNVLLNPNHPGCDPLEPVDEDDFEFDARLWSV